MFRSLTHVDSVPQITAIQFWRGVGGRTTSERGSDSAEAHLRAIVDEEGRFLVVMTHNTDIADAWEHEGEDPRFFQTVRTRRVRPGHQRSSARDDSLVRGCTRCRVHPPPCAYPAPQTAPAPARRVASVTRRLRCGAQLRYNARTCTLVLQGRLDFTKRYMLHRLICLLRRQHDYSLKEGHGHVFLFCRRCGVRTPGWETSPRFRVVEPASEPRQATRSDPWAKLPFRQVSQPNPPDFLSSASSWTNLFRHL